MGNLGSPIVTKVPPGLSIPHPVRKWAALVDQNGSLVKNNVTGVGYGPGSTLPVTVPANLPAASPPPEARTPTPG